MSLGLRPRLKARPSFLDLIKIQHIDTLSIAPVELNQDPLPQLPLSPPPTTIQFALPKPNKEIVNMAPQRDADGEEQYGLSSVISHGIPTQLLIAVLQVQFTPYQGSSKTSLTCMHSHSANHLQSCRGGGEHDWSCYVRVGKSGVHDRGSHCVLTCRQVRVGHDNLVGEVIRIEADRATIQVYEETGMGTYMGLG